MTELICPLHEAAQISRDQPAILSPDRDLIFSEVDEMASWVAYNLYQRGVRSGDRVGLYVAQDWRYPVLLLGILRAGGVACLVSTRIPREAVVRQLGSIGCDKVIARVRDPEQVAKEGLTAFEPGEIMMAPLEPLPPVAHRYVGLDQAATILFTSGSSGMPKAVLHTFGNHYYSARGANENLRLRSRDRWLVNLPMYHVGGLGILFRCLLSGATMVFPAPGDTLEEGQAAYAVTHLSLVPTQLKRLVDRPDPPDGFAKLKAILLGGSPCDPATLSAALRRNWPVFTTYGLTEMASQVTTMPPDAPRTKRMTSGLLLHHRELAIDERGELLVKGPCLFSGYVEGEDVVPAVDGEGWFHTNDRGSVDEEGYLTVTGRFDSMFISGGENIHPEMIEAVLGSIPGIRRAVVASIPDEEFGRRPVAFVSREEVPDDVIDGALGRALPSFMRPLAYYEWPEGEEWNEDKIERDKWNLLAEALYHANG
ncbi:MAG TPA: o-succinylbenzoate--CoA ligase [Kiritimatiellia bacterium]|nr:o-succinylbenzoate--CoA ligase [Kiritimatiellia bacterium]